jgi:MoaA/NifB/PqqE/SkfB family radical SAM enzyme
MVFDSIGRIRICCGNFDYVLGDIRQERLDDIWNGARLARIREALRSYDLSLGCSICHHKITAGVVEGSTLRTTQLIALKFEEFAVEPEAPYWPKHLEFHLSNRCNMACVTCFGEFSSTIRAGRDKLPPYPRMYGDQFFVDLRKYLSHLKAAQFLGGEPFLIPEMYRVWDMLVEDQLAPDCHVTTNGTVFDARVERVLDKLPMSVSVSMDGVTAKTFESIRVNGRFDTVLGNLRRFKEMCRSRGRYIGINFTLSRLNWHEFVDFLLFAESEDVDVSASEVYFPVDLSLYTLSHDELQRVADTLEQQAGHVARDLPRNKQVLDVRLRELRHFLGDSDPLHDLYASSRKGGASLVIGFRGTVAPAGGTAPVHAKARQLLEAWNEGGRISEIVADINDVIVEAGPDTTSVFAWSVGFIGRSFADWVAMLLQELGPNLVQLSMDKEPCYEDRTFRLERPDVAPTVLRVITVPYYDENATLCGARALLATKQPAWPSTVARQELEHA